MMKNISLFYLGLVALLFQSCSKSDLEVYAWLSGPGSLNDKEVYAEFSDLRKKGVDGLMYSAGQDPETYERIGRIAHKCKLEFHAWVPAMLQGRAGLLDFSDYALNGKGESAWDKPAYVDYYKFLCPSRISVHSFLADMYGKIAAVSEVDGIHLDYIRYPDVILAKGLWDKYGLVMDREYPQYDYCYCDTCLAAFENKYGVHIRSVDDPSSNAEWKQFRCDLITSLVNELAEIVHARDKVITAAVFPGPTSVAKKIVRQEWDKWKLDAFYPMNYNDFYLEDTEWIGDVCSEAVNAINNEVPVYSGLFIRPGNNESMEGNDPENKGLSPSEFKEAILESMNNGCRGICIFTPARMSEEHWKVLKKIKRQFSN